MFDFYKTGEQVYEYPFNTANWPTNYYSFDVLQGTKCAKNAVIIFSYLKKNISFIYSKRQIIT